MNILIIGGGFIGLGIKKILEENDRYSNIYLKTRKNELPDQPIDYVIDATCQSSKRECDNMLVELESISNLYHGSKILILQSFSTLQDNPICSEIMNFGCKDYFHTPYSKIKLYKEKVLLSNISLSKKLFFLYLPVVLGENGPWAKHAIRLNTSKKKIQIPLAKVYWTSLEHISNVISDLIFCKGKRRVVVSEGMEYLDNLLIINNTKRNNIRNTKLMDKIYIKLFSIFRNRPLFINALFIIVEKIHFRDVEKFPSAFYWFLFVKQETMMFNCDKDE